ncbi:MAG: hypothetical protein V9E83_03405 [Baekduia sp.]
MKLATILPPGGGSPLAAEVRGDVVHPYDPGTTVLGLLAAGGEPPAATGDGIALDGVTLLAPLPEPRVLYGVGLNYAGHAAEQGAELPSAPIIFTMQPGERGTAVRRDRLPAGRRVGSTTRASWR